MLYVHVCMWASALSSLRSLMHTLLLILTTVIYNVVLSQYTRVRWGEIKQPPTPTPQKQQQKTEKQQQKTSFSVDWGSFSSQRRLQHFAMLLKLKDSHTFWGISGLYSTSGYTAVIFSTPLVAVKCEVFTTSSSTREMSASNTADLFPLLPANHVRVPHSTAHTRRFKWKGSIHQNNIKSLSFCQIPAKTNAGVANMQ